MSMSYEDHIKVIFIGHHISMGLDIEDANKLFDESRFKDVEKWLSKNGYDHETLL